MGHFCRICCEHKPNEQFTGKGHKIHICKQCIKLPKAKRRNIERREEIAGYISQSNISKKNKKCFKELMESEDEEIAELASIVHQVALIKPIKKKRIKLLASKHKDLLKKLEDAGLIYIL
ncbi:MAG: hypothetical protein ACLFR1_08545 [Spirochaetia bacterium]